MRSFRGNERILFIDDEEQLAAVSKITLEQYGYSVSTYTSSTEALKAFKDNPDQFDLVITDQTMPKMAGTKLAMKLLQIRPDLPIIICTGYTSASVREETKQMRIRGYLEKPIGMMEMAEMIRKVLDES